MNKLFCVLMLTGIFSSAVFSQWNSNPAVNLKVCDTTGSQELTKISPTTDGGCYISWFDTRGGSYAVYLQRLDAAGVKQFASGGLLISSNPQNTSLVDYDLKTDASNNAIIAFTDIRNSGQVNPFAYCISPAGSFIWGANGVTLSTTNATFQANPKISVTSDGNYVIAWIFSSSPNKLAMQKLNSSGTKQWGTDPVYIAGAGTENFTYPDLVTSDNGSIIMMWSGYGGTFINPTNYRIYSQKFSSAGTAVWNATMDTVYGTNYVSGFYVPRIFSDGNNGAIYCWHDFRGNTNYQTGYAQRTNSAGVFQFPVNGSAVSTTAGNNHFDPVAAYMPSTSETYVFFTETNNNQSLFGVYGQKFSTAGVRLWPDAGQLFVGLNQNQPAYMWTYSKDTNVMCYYDEAIFGSANSLVKALRCGRAGVMSWGGSVVSASTVLSAKVRLNVTISAAAGMSMLTWADNRQDGNGVYAQNINYDGSGLTGINNIGGSVPGKYSLGQNYPNPFNPSTKIRFAIPAGTSSAMVKLTVFDVLGREVATLVNSQLNPGNYEISWDASNYSSGVYFYKLNAGGYSEIKKMSLIK